MLSRDEIEALLIGIGLPLPGQTLVMKAREESPVRKVNSTISNVLTHYFSKKMNRIISTESRSAEQAGAYLYEFDSRVLEYFPQPLRVDLTLKTSNTQKNCPFVHFPDFMVITVDGVFIDEWKTEEHLQKLSASQPQRYVFECNQWRSPILEEHFGKFGFHYSIRSTATIPQCRLQNNIFLADFIDPAFGFSSPEAIEILKNKFIDLAEIPLIDLIEEAQSNESLFSVDDVYRAIAVGNLFINIDLDQISDTSRTMVYRDEISMRILSQHRITPVKDIPILARNLTQGSRIELDGQRLEVTFMGETDVVLNGTHGETILSLNKVMEFIDRGKINLTTLPLSKDTDERSKLCSLSPDQMAEIESRRECLAMAKIAGSNLNRSSRTLCRYRKSMREAGDNILDQQLALVSRKADKGNREPRLAQNILELIEKIQIERHNTPRAPSKEASYIEFSGACRSAGLNPCSKRTFLQKLRTSVVKREGTRRAYQLNPITAFLHMNDHVHGVRPFEIVHIDCTPLEIVLRGPNGTKSLGTVYLCLAMDAESRAALAKHLSFEKPSARTTLTEVLNGIGALTKW